MTNTPFDQTASPNWGRLLRNSFRKSIFQQSIVRLLCLLLRSPSSDPVGIFLITVYISRNSRLWPWLFSLSRVLLRCVGRKSFDINNTNGDGPSNKYLTTRSRGEWDGDTHQLGLGHEEGACWSAGRAIVRLIQQRGHRDNWVQCKTISILPRWRQPQISISRHCVGEYNG